jgi:NADPH-dependent 2,4-dienoyl-CoA reductase/sulfur reductase-like enzyme
MKKYQYIIIGGGMSGSAAVKGIREFDPDGSIALFSDEGFPPYNRPPLTKGLWDGKKIEDITRSLESYNADLFLKTRIKKINRDQKTIVDDSGEEFAYHKLLLAIGGHPAQLPDAPEGVIYYRTLEDYQSLKSLSESKDRFCVIGGGFIGSEIAAALSKQGNQVTMIFPENGISGALFPDDLAEFLNHYYQGKGVRVLNGNLAKKISRVGEEFIVEYQSLDEKTKGSETFDGVVVGIGIKPNTRLAQEAGLEVSDGIIVNEYLQTNDPDIFAAGDVSFFKNLALDKQERVEHEDNALSMGTLAGQNMTGQMKKYGNLPFFYSDLFDLGYEAVGELNKDFEIHSDWIEKYKKGTVFYMENGKIRGLVFWNLWGKVDQGRQIIKEAKNHQKDELAKLFN